MFRHDRWPRLSLERWVAPIPVDGTDAGGWSIAFTWLGFMVELGAGRRTAIWRAAELDADWVQMMREIKDLPIHEQHARLMGKEAAHG